MIEKTRFFLDPKLFANFEYFKKYFFCTGPRTVCKNRGLARPAVGVFVNGFWNFRVGCLVSRIHQFVSRVGCLVSRVSCRVSRVSCLVSRVGCLVSRISWVVYHIS